VQARNRRVRRSVYDALLDVFGMHGKFFQRPVIHTSTLGSALSDDDRSIFVEYLSVCPWQQANQTMPTPCLALARLCTTPVHVILVLPTLLPVY
jgi:hypothetical protein